MPAIKNRCALKTDGILENRNAQSSVRFLGEEEQQVYEGLAVSYARRLPSVALLRRGMRGKPFGFPLKIAEFFFNSLKQISQVFF